jgi:acetylornithine deacetylase/succinyl-diaminopimelate desuccinylase-like protein
MATPSSGLRRVAGWAPAPRPSCRLRLVRQSAAGWGATRGGGSIPVVADIAALLGIPVVLMGFGLDDDGLHSPNERYSLEMFQRGIETTIVYLEGLAQLPGKTRG